MLQDDIPYGKIQTIEELGRLDPPEIHVSDPAPLDDWPMNRRNRNCEGGTTASRVLEPRSRRHQKYHRT